MQEVHNSDDVMASLRRVLSRLDSLSSVDVGLVSVASRPVLHTRLQLAFNMRSEHVLDKALYELVMSHAVAAERLGPGAFVRCIDLIKRGFDDSRDPLTCRPSSVLARSVSKSNVVELINEHAKSARRVTSDMLTAALELAGYGGRIIVEKTTSAVPSVELVRGHTFELQQLLPMDVSFVSPRVVCIDGYVEDVSEIHHLLEAASTAKEPCVMFVRGMSDDVKHTLKVNYDRGSLRVVPLGVRFDLDGMNTLVDLSVVTGADLVSSLKGDLISSIKFHEVPRVEQVTVFKGRTVITHSGTRRAVSAHVSGLKKRRVDAQVDDVGKLLDKRIKSLSPNHVIVRLPDDRDFVTSSQAIDYALRAVRSAITYGIVEGKPAATELAAQTHATRCCKTLSDLGAFVSLDSELVRVEAGVD